VAGTQVYRFISEKLLNKQLFVKTLKLATTTSKRESDAIKTHSKYKVDKAIAV
jgi:hypothetical protein